VEGSGRENPVNPAVSFSKKETESESYADQYRIRKNRDGGLTISNCSLDLDANFMLCIHYFIILA
jgi:hypothetical protein